jgi:hypothetical protein
MRRTARRARSTSQRVRVFTVLTVLATAAACGTALLIPSKVGAAALTSRLDSLGPRQLTVTTDTGQAFGGVAAVGALFTVSGGELGKHFCTASVVHSTHGDLVLAAAHCMTGIQGQIVFVPGYANGKDPYGVWPVTAVYADQAWQSSRNPDDDFAFLRLSDASGVPIEDVTGAERLGLGWPVPALVQVIGYPDDVDQPISCANSAKRFSPTQLEFDCGGYSVGTSGGPFLTDVSAASGQGTVIGVIGGYEAGGDSPEVSYAAAFGAAATALYQSAEAGG